MASPPRSKVGGYVDVKTLPRGPNGRVLCRWCTNEVPQGRRTFCGQPCIDEWTIRTNPGVAARKVEERDKGVCAICKLDTAALKREFRALPHGYANRMGWLRERGLPQALISRRRWFDVDHIVPVIEGGGSCGLENLRTLCLTCHRVVTAALAARRAQARRAG
jgi:hypothetical protein